MKKALWITPLTLLAALIGVLYYSQPYISKFVLEKVIEAIESKAPVKVSIETFDYHLFLPRVELEGIKVKSQMKGISDLDIKLIEAYLDIPDLIAGQFSLSEIWIHEVDSTIRIDQLPKDPNSEMIIPVKDILALAQKLPIAKIFAKNWKLNILSTEDKLNIPLNDLSLLIKNSKSKLEARGSLQIAEGKIKTYSNPQTDLALVMTLNKSAIEIDQLIVSALDSKIQLEGVFQNPEKLLLNPEGKIKYDMSLTTDKLSLETKKYLKFPALQGLLLSQGELTINGIKNIKATGALKSQALKVDEFWIGDVFLKAQFADKKITSDKIEIKNPGGRATLNNVEWKYNNENSFQSWIKGELATKHIDLHELLKALDVGDLPLELLIEGNLNCEGPLSPTPNVTCKGKLGGNNMEVRSGDQATDIIAALDEFETQGSVTITNQQVSYAAQLNVQGDAGKSEGVIHYDNGFQISFETPKLSFGKVRSLANLNIEGETGLKGTTSGDSNAAVFELAFEGKNMFLENYFLGEPKGNITYKSGRLKFLNTRSRIGTSYLDAEIELNLPEKQIEISAKGDHMNLGDLPPIFYHLYEFPFELAGSVDMNAKIWGPLVLNQLSYDAKFNLHNPIVRGERFDSGFISVASDRGQFEIREAKIYKNKSIVSASGLGFPDGQVNFLVRGSRFLLEESETVTKIGTDISGVFDFALDLTGPIFSPDVKFNGRISDLTVDQEELQNSEASVKFSKRFIEGSANFLNGKVKSQFQLPFSADDPMRLNIKTINWNYSSLAALIGGGDLIKSYQSGLTAFLDLNSERGGIWNATGTGEIKKVFLKRDNLSFENTQPILLTMNKGKISLKDFILLGPETNLELKGEDFTSQRLNVTAKGSTNLRLLHVFLPFLEDLSGKATISTNFAGPITKPEIYGSAQLQNGFIKIKGFPHPFEQLLGQVQFSQNKIIIEKISGLLATGKLLGSGSILIEERNLNCNIKANLQNATFNVPDKIQTTGNADVTLTGNWFPFLLSGTYHVQGGLFRKEFTEETGRAVIKQSSYLPKVILQKSFEPLLLDLQINFDKPLAIKNSMVDGSVDGALQIKGPPRSPTILGKLNMGKQSKLTFRDKIFEITTANVNFNDPDQLDPEIYLNARSRINEYDVSLLAQGKGKNRLIRLTSVPPLAEKDIISLLALGITSDNLAKKSTQDQNESNAYNELGAQILANTPLSKNLQQNLGVDLQITNQYDDTKGAAVQKITLSRKISEKVNASASRLQGKQSSTEVKLQYKINNNVSAIGTYENRSTSETGVNNSNQDQGSTQSIFGIDLEYKKEFK